MAKMTLIEAIKHFEEKASSMKSCAITWKTTAKSCVSERVRENSLKEYELCKEYAEEHEQLAEWLKELKDRRENERPQGEWILQYRDCGDEYYTCSICERAIEVENGRSLKDFPYCHCGAKMKGGAEE